MEARRHDVLSWPDLAIGLYEKLTERNAEISYRFDDFKVQVPSSVSPQAQHAPWEFSGTLVISCRDKDA